MNTRYHTGLQNRSRVLPKHNVNIQHQPFVATQSRSATGLRGVDLVEQVAQNTAIQRRRWTEYGNVRETQSRNALILYFAQVVSSIMGTEVSLRTKLDIADTILFVNGNPSDWYFTSAVTGEVKRKSSSKLDAVAIRHHCAKVSVLPDQSRHRLRARLVHEEFGQLVYTPLRDGEIGFVLSQPPSDLAVATVLLQPLVPAARQPANAKGTFVAKYNIAATSSCTRVLHLENGGLYGLLPSQSVAASAEILGAAYSRRPHSAPVTTQSHQFEQVVKGELRRLIHEVEGAFRDRVRLLTADFQITDQHRLVLVRISSVVFFSDLAMKKEVPVSVLRDFDGGHRRKAQTAIAADDSKCTGRAFCHCIEVANAPALSQFRSSKKQPELCRITRKSVSLSENESAFLARFGADAEATLRAVESSDLTATSSWTRRGKTGSGRCPAVMKLLERRIFMLQNTLWNPKSDAFDPKALEFEVAQLLPHEYEMVTVCQACHLVYQAIDDVRFNRSRETAAAAARRSSELFRSKFLDSERASIATMRRAPNAAKGHVREAWEDEEDHNS